MKPNIRLQTTKTGSLALILLILTGLSGCGSPGATKIDDDTFYQLEADVAAVANSAVADAAPLEIKGIQEKLQLAKKAKADRDRRTEAQLTEQIYADIQLAKKRAELKQKNNDLLDLRDQVSSAQVYLMELKERLQ
ncbi:hypothetical protein [Marinicella meishanensis]|uniref:hypothetical protein n=1 Tax=Marinicella meishanensis TaxID=2873263 RepID=UPI001CC18D1E|nr:hypothetical protein [Marinicella sp. NBU2979]